MVVFCAIIPMVTAAMTALVKRKLTQHSDAAEDEVAHGKYASIRQRKMPAGATKKLFLVDAETNSVSGHSKKMMI
jgi:hypothetical protein